MRLAHRAAEEVAHRGGQRRARILAVFTCGRRMAGAAGRRWAGSPERDWSPYPSGPGARATSRTLTRFAPGGRARLHQPDYAFSLLGASPVPAKSLLATIALALAAVQVLLALWIYGKLPLPGPPRQVPLAHRLTGAAGLAGTVPGAGIGRAH